MSVDSIHFTPPLFEQSIVLHIKASLKDQVKLFLCSILIAGRRKICRGSPHSEVLRGLFLTISIVLMDLVSGK